MNDQAGISGVMNKYLFEVCFNPFINEDNIYYFADYCLSNLHNGFWDGLSEDGYRATPTGLADGLDPAELKKYWTKFGSEIKRKKLPEIKNKGVVTVNYTATYAKDLPKVFEVLDEMVG